MMPRIEVWSAFGRPWLAPVILILTILNTSPAISAVDHDAILRDRLNDVRELLDRRQAYRSMLNGKIARFSHTLDQLQLERNGALEMLADQQDRARASERELDKLMPRLLPRLRRLDQFRKNGAQAIAGLATMERHTSLEDKTRSRLAATQTTSIEQMRRASTALRRLRRVPNALTARHRDVDFQIPLLAASVSRLDLRQNQLQRRRDKAIRDLADLTIDIDRLTAEEHRLARNMIARSLEASDQVVASSSRFKAALQNRRGVGKASVGGADVRGIALRQTQPTPVARPIDRIRASSGLASVDRTGSSGAVLSAKAQTTALVAGWASRKKPWAAAVASAKSTAVEPNSGSALVPTIETIGFTGGIDSLSDGRPEIEIAALPLQEVAAPHDGVVAFAGDFRSYGLLLIIEHGNGYHTLLWGFSSLDTELGDTVQAGEIVGIVRDGPSPKLHVELRRNGQPVSPEVWLAASNSGVKG